MRPVRDPVRHGSHRSGLRGTLLWSNVVSAAAALVAVSVLLAGVDGWRFAAAAAAGAWAAFRAVGAGLETRRHRSTARGAPDVVLLAALDAIVFLFASVAAPVVAVGCLALLFTVVVAASTFSVVAACTTASGAAVGVALLTIAGADALGGFGNGLLLAAAFGLTAVVIPAGARGVSSNWAATQTDPAEALMAMSEAAAGEDFDALLDSIGGVLSALGGPTGWVLWLRPAGSDLVIERRWGTRASDESALALFTRDFGARRSGTDPSAPGYELAGMLEAGRVVTVNRVDEVASPERDLLESVGVGACLFLPVGVEDRLWGTLAGFRRRRSGPFEPGEVDLLGRLARLVGSELAAFDERSSAGSGGGPHSTVSTQLTALASELRDPVSVIAGFAGTLAESDHRFGRLQRRRYHRLIEAQGKALGRTVDELAVVVDAEAVGLRIFRRPVGGHEIRREVESRIESDDSVRFRTDEGSRFSVDLRLVGLAVGGLVGVTRAHCEGPVEVSLTPGHLGAVLISVSGAGPNASWTDVAALAARIADRDASAIWSGRTALTLACAAAVAVAHGGSLRVHSDTGSAGFSVDVAPVEAGAIAAS